MSDTQVEQSRWHEFLTYGRRIDKLRFSPEVWATGGCKDGVAIRLADEQGSWLISFDDLVKMADLARKIRDTNNE